jgi:hypothetical protein
MFFFEKKEPKNFYLWRAAAGSGARQRRCPQRTKEHFSCARFCGN